MSIHLGGRGPGHIARVQGGRVNLFTNGDFASSSVADWTRGFNSVDGTLAVVGGVLVHTRGAGDSGAARWCKAISGLTNGATYTLSFQEAGATGSGDRCIVWTSNSAGTGGDTLNQVGVAAWTNEVKTNSVTATATTMYVSLGFVGASAGDTIGVDNITLYPA